MVGCADRRIDEIEGVFGGVCIIVGPDRKLLRQMALPVCHPARSGLWRWGSKRTCQFEILKVPTIPLNWPAALRNGVPCTSTETAELSLRRSLK
jgi:hypothetical protein